MSASTRSYIEKLAAKRLAEQRERLQRQHATKADTAEETAVTTGGAQQQQQQPQHNPILGNTGPPIVSLPPPPVQPAVAEEPVPVITTRSSGAEDDEPSTAAATTAAAEPVPLELSKEARDVLLRVAQAIRRADGGHDRADEPPSPVRGPRTENDDGGKSPGDVTAAAQGADDTHPHCTDVATHHHVQRLEEQLRRVLEHFDHRQSSAFACLPEVLIPADADVDAGGGDTTAAAAGSDDDGGAPVVASQRAFVPSELFFAATVGAAATSSESTDPVALRKVAAMPPSLRKNAEEDDGGGNDEEERAAEDSDGWPWAGEVATRVMNDVCPAAARTPSSRAAWRRLVEAVLVVLLTPHGSDDDDDDSDDDDDDGTSHVDLVEDSTPSKNEHHSGSVAAVAAVTGEDEAAVSPTAHSGSSAVPPKTAGGDSSPTAPTAEVSTVAAPQPEEPDAVDKAVANLSRLTDEVAERFGTSFADPCALDAVCAAAAELTFLCPLLRPNATAAISESQVPATEAVVTRASTVLLLGGGGQKGVLPVALRQLTSSARGAARAPAVSAALATAVHYVPSEYLVPNAGNIYSTLVDCLQAGSDPAPATEHLSIAVACELAAAVFARLPPANRSQPVIGRVLAKLAEAITRWRARPYPSRHVQDFRTHFDMVRYGVAQVGGLVSAAASVTELAAFQAVLAKLHSDRDAHAGVKRVEALAETRRMELSAVARENTEFEKLKSGGLWKELKNRGNTLLPWIFERAVKNHPRYADGRRVMDIMFGDQTKLREAFANRSDLAPVFANALRQQKLLTEADAKALLEAVVRGSLVSQLLTKQPVTGKSNLSPKKQKKLQQKQGELNKKENLVLALLTHAPRTAVPDLADAILRRADLSPTTDGKLLSPQPVTQDALMLALPLARPPAQKDFVEKLCGRPNGQRAAQWLATKAGLKSPIERFLKDLLTPVEHVTPATLWDTLGKNPDFFDRLVERASMPSGHEVAKPLLEALVAGPRGKEFIFRKTNGATALSIAKVAERCLSPTTMATFCSMVLNCGNPTIVSSVVLDPAGHKLYARVITHGKGFPAQGIADLMRKLASHVLPSQKVAKSTSFGDMLKAVFLRSTPAARATLIAYYIKQSRKDILGVLAAIRSLPPDVKWSLQGALPNVRLDIAPEAPPQQQNQQQAAPQGGGGMVPTPPTSATKTATAAVARPQQANSPLPPVLEQAPPVTPEQLASALERAGMPAFSTAWNGLTGDQGRRLVNALRLDRSAAARLGLYVHLHRVAPHAQDLATRLLLPPRAIDLAAELSASVVETLQRSPPLPAVSEAFPDVAASWDVVKRCVAVVGTTLLVTDVRGWLRAAVPLGAAAGNSAVRDAIAMLRHPPPAFAADMGDQYYFGTSDFAGVDPHVLTVAVPQPGEDPAVRELQNDVIRRLVARTEQLARWLGECRRATGAHLAPMAHLWAVASHDAFTMAHQQSRHV